MENNSNHYLPVDTILVGKDYQYRIQKVLGEGSFGITYLAKAKISIAGRLGNLHTEMDVAIKEFFMKEINTRTGTSVDSGSQSGIFRSYRNKFQKEALNLSKMQHTGIVKVLEVFKQNNTSYIVMEFMNGGSLDDYILRKGRVSEEEAIRHIGNVANALAYMHSQQMLHLDLKPQNIMFNANQQPVIIDFGLSKHYNVSGEPESSTSIGLGTPGYSPLEQADCQEAKDFQPTLDVYALGATLYKMLTGKTPPTASAVLNSPSLLHDKLLQAGVSQKYRDLVLAAMQPLKGARPQTVEEFLVRIQTQPQTVEQITDKDDESTLINTVPKVVRTPRPRRKPVNEVVDKADIKTPPSSETTVCEEKKKDVLERVENISQHEKDDVGHVIKLKSGKQVVLPPTEILLDSFKKNEHHYSDFLPGHNLSFHEKVFMDLHQNRVLHIDDVRFHGSYAPLMYKGKYGFVNKYGVLVTEFKYDKVKFIEWKNFSVKYNGKWGLLNNELNTIFECIYDHELIESDGMIAICKQGKWGFMDFKWSTESPGFKSTIVIDYQYDAVGRFIDGLAMVKKDGLFGYIDRKGAEVVPIKYEGCHDERRKEGDKTLILKKNDWWLCTDLRGCQTIPVDCGKEIFEIHNQYSITSYDGFYRLNHILGYTIWTAQFIERRDGEEVYRVSSNNKYNLLNPVWQKQPLATEWFEHIGPFVDELAVVKRNGLYGVINTKGEEVIPCSYEWMSAEPVAGRVIVKENLRNWILNINTGRKGSCDFTIVKQMDEWPCWYLAQKKEKLGLVDGKGDEILSMIYDDVIPLTDELLLATYNKNYPRLINLPDVGRSCVYTQESFNEGLCRVTFIGEIAFLNEEGKVVIPFMPGMGEVNNTFKPFKNGIVCIKGKFTDRQNRKIPVVNSKLTYLIIWITGLILFALFMIGWAWVSPQAWMNDLVMFLGLKTLLLSVFRWILHLIGWLGVYAILGGMFITSVIGCIWAIRQKYSKKALLPQTVFPKKYLWGFQDHAYLMTEGLLAVKKEDKWGFINAKGETIIPFSYDWVSVFEHGIAQAMSGDKRMTLDKKELRID